MNKRTKGEECTREVREMIKVSMSHKVKEKRILETVTRCNGKKKKKALFPYIKYIPPFLPPPPSSTSLFPLKRCWNRTAQMMRLHRIKLAAAAKALSHADSAVL